MKSNLILTVAAALMFAAAAGAADLTTIKQAMKDRKPAVEQALATKQVGENRAGFLQAVGQADAAQAKLIAEENADRKTVYQAIAAKEGTDAAAVGKLRAEKIAATAKPGTMLQERDGTWAEKK